MTLLISIILLFSVLISIPISIFLFKKFYITCPECGHVFRKYEKTRVMKTRKFKYHIINCPNCSYRGYLKTENNKPCNF